MGTLSRLRPWLWGTAAILALFALGWLEEGRGTRGIGVIDQWGNIARFTLPPVAIVGAVMSRLPDRHRLLRMAFAVTLALYVSGIASVFTFRITDCDPGERCALAAPARFVGLTGQLLVWGVGPGTEALFRRVRG